MSESHTFEILSKPADLSATTLATSEWQTLNISFYTLPYLLAGFNDNPQLDKEVLFFPETRRVCKELRLK